MEYIDGLVQDCSDSSALAMELLQSCTKLSILCKFNHTELRLQPMLYVQTTYHIPWATL